MLLRIVSATLLFWFAFHLTAGTIDDEEVNPVLKEDPTAEFRKIHQGIALFRFTKDRKIYWWVQNTTRDWVCVWTRVTKRGREPYMVFFSVSVPPNGGERLLGIVEKPRFWITDYEFNWYVQPLKKPSDYKVYGQCSSERIANDYRIPETDFSLPSLQARTKGENDSHRRGH